MVSKKKWRPAMPEFLKKGKIDNEEIKKFLHTMYERGSELLKEGAKKAAETSEKVAHATTLYYQFNQLKVKIYVMHAKIGEYADKNFYNGATAFDVHNDAGLKLLFEELNALKAQLESTKQQISKL
jgi:hypothetical protein